MKTKDLLDRLGAAGSARLWALDPVSLLILVCKQHPGPTETMERLDVRTFVSIEWAKAVPKNHNQPAQSPGNFSSSSVAATGRDADYVSIIKSKTDPEKGATI